MHMAWLLISGVDVNISGEQVGFDLDVSTHWIPWIPSFWQAKRSHCDEVVDEVVEPAGFTELPAGELLVVFTVFDDADDDGAETGAIGGELVGDFVSSASCNLLGWAGAVAGAGEGDDGFGGEAGAGAGAGADGGGGDDGDDDFGGLDPDPGITFPFASNDSIFSISKVPSSCLLCAFTNVERKVMNRPIVNI